MFEKEGVSPNQSKEIPNIGVINGATNMAPMTTAVLFVTNPKLAINVDPATKI